MKGVSLKKHLALMHNLPQQRTKVKEHKLTRLYWECTSRCNLNCLHCGTYCRMLPDLSDMPIDDFVQVLENVAKTENPLSVTVILTGGEPLLRKDLVECGRQIYSHGFPWGINTNGKLLSRELLMNLMAAGLLHVMIRLDGPEYEHNWLCGDKECFAHTQEAIRMVCEEKGLVCEVSTCVNQRNFDYLNELYALLRQLGVKHWRLYTAYPKGKAANNNDLMLDSYQLRELMEFIKKVRKEGVIDTYYGCEGFLGQYERQVRDDFYMCHAGVSTGSVLINGDITGCQNVSHKYSQGNIYEGDEFMDIWNTCFDVFRKRKWMHTGICTHCKAFKYCQGNGMHLRSDDGDLLMCNYDRLNLR